MNEAAKAPPPAPMIPPPPPPPPTSAPLFAVTNDGTVGEGKWKLRTETANERVAEGTIEIPQRRSVASLRQQIADKLDTKSALRPPASSSGLAGPFGGIEIHQRNGHHHHSERSVEPSIPDRIPSKMSEPSPNGVVHSTSNSMQPIVHGPTQRYMSCITPTSLNRSVVIASSVSYPAADHQPAASSIADQQSPSWSTTGRQSSIAGHQQITNGNQWPNRAHRLADDGLEGRGSIMRDRRSLNRFTNEQQQSLSNGTTNSFVQSPPDGDHSSHWYRNMFKQMHQINEPDYSILEYRNKEAIAPVSVINRRLNRAWTPNPRSGDIETHSPQRNIRSRSVGRYVETPSLNEDQQIVERWRQELAHLASSQLKPDVVDMDRQQQQPECSSRGLSAYSSKSHQWPLTSRSSPTNHQDTNSLNCFAQESSKTRHFHLPPYRFTQPDGRLKCVKTGSRTCGDCCCSKLSWRQIEYIYESLGKDGVHLESFTDDLCRLLRASSVSERLNELSKHLQWLLDGLDMKPQKANLLAGKLTNVSFPSANPDGTAENGHSLSSDVMQMKRLAKEELLTRQKVEKLSEELKNQRERRHGYIPSSSPALQRNFERFSGLINEFGYLDNCTTPRALSPCSITTCTALYSFKALSLKELSFNRGDVIRVHRKIDANWMQGERNGQVGIFPSSYVQMDNNSVGEQVKLIALYQFHARNNNELSLKKGETLRFVRIVDSNWLEGVNSHGQTGIFPKTYVRELIDEESIGSAADIDSIIPDRPKTPRIGHSSQTFVSL